MSARRGPALTRWVAVAAAALVSGALIAAPGGLVDSPLIAGPFSQPVVSAAQTRTGQPIVLAAIDVHKTTQSGRSYAIIHPIAVSGAGRYREAVIGGADIEQVRRRASKSILTQVTTFTVYRRGSRLGVARVLKVVATQDHALHCAPSVAGFGVIDWHRRVDFSGANTTTLFVNGRGDVAPDTPAEGTGYSSVETRVLRFSALSVPRSAPAFLPPAQALSREQRRVLEGIARMWASVAAARRWDSIGPVTLRGDVRLTSADVIDIDRDGRLEVVAAFNAPLRKPSTGAPGEPAPAVLMFMVMTHPSRGRPSVLLSLPTLTGVGPDASEDYGFETALDIDGDGIAELVLIHEFFYEDARYEIYSLRRTRLVPVFTGALQGC